MTPDAVAETDAMGADTMGPGRGVTCSCAVYAVRCEFVPRAMKLDAQRQDTVYHTTEAQRLRTAEPDERVALCTTISMRN